MRSFLLALLQEGCRHGSCFRRQRGQMETWQEKGNEGTESSSRESSAMRLVRREGGSRSSGSDGFQGLITYLGDNDGHDRSVLSTSAF